MKRFLKWLPATLALAGFALLGPPRAHATLMLEVQQAGFNFGTVAQPTSEIIFVDNNTGVTPGTPSDPDADTDLEQVGNDFNPLVGSLQLGVTNNTPTTVGGLTVTGSVHTSNSPGTPIAGGLAQLASQSFAVENLSGSTVTQKVIVGDTGYTIPNGSTAWGFQISAFIAGNVSIRNRAWDDPGNQQFGGSDGHTNGTALLLADDTEFGTFNKTFTGTSLVGAGPYAKTIEFDITLDPGASITLRNDQLQNSATPEPASLLMAVLALPVLAVGRWLPRRKDKATV